MSGTVGSGVRDRANKCAFGTMKEGSVQNAAQCSVERNMSSKCLLKSHARKNKWSPQMGLCAFFVRK